MKETFTLYMMWAFVQSGYNITQNMMVSSGKTTLNMFIIITLPILVASNYLWLHAFNTGINKELPVAIIMGGSSMLFIIVSSILGFIVLKNTLSTTMVIGMIITLIGIAIMNYK